MKPTRTRRLLMGGTVTLVAGWLGLMALVVPALLGAVAAATLLPLTLVALPYLAVGAVVRVNAWRRPSPEPSRSRDAGRAGDARDSSSDTRAESGTTAAD